MKSLITSAALCWGFFQSVTSQSAAPTKDVSDCLCGFYDAEADIVYTDAQIVYFNETDGFPEEEYVIQNYKHMRDFGWNTLYRQGATKNNVNVGNDTTARNLTALQLFLDPSTPEHLVMGANVRTQRQDIFFGSFRASMRPPRQWFDGSAMSMVLHHNLTESWSLDVMNTNNHSQAWVSFLATNVFANTWLGTNFSTLLNESMNPWYYTEYRVDWSREQIDYYIGNKLRHSYTKKENHTLPSTPAAIQYKHWSVGNRYTTQGPPQNRTEADVAWTRHFFNSSLTTKDEKKDFDAKCTAADACPASDNSLRGSTPYSKEARKKWHQTPDRRHAPWVPILIDVVMGGIFVVLVTKTLWRRFYRKKFKGKPDSEHEHGGMATGSQINLKLADMTETASTSSGSIIRSNAGSIESFGPESELPRNASYESFHAGPPIYSGMHTPAPEYQTPNSSRWPSRKNSSYNITIRPTDAHVRGLSNPSESQNLSPRGDSRDRPRNMSEFYGDKSQTSLAKDRNPFLARIDTEVVTPAPEAVSRSPLTPSSASPDASTPRRHGLSTIPHGSNPSLFFQKPEPKVKAARSTTQPQTGEKSGKPPPAQRVDYLAGFIALSAILVTLNHFALTFFPAVIEPGVPYHYSSEMWARKTFATYIFDALWIGPFLMISTRFLVSNYLRTGKLDNMAQKIVVRPFRLLTPVAAIALLEYFLMDSGALHYLEYLPSVTWSTWPYAVIVANPGVFISQIIQLAFLIPNAAPMITYTYCTGVLWTIPVQLQGAWQTLLALIMVKECKTPWKRFAFYAFCICNHWYGLSWGSYYYAGVMLADLDLTYQYKKWLHARPLVYYPLLWFLIAVALGGFTIDLVFQWTNVSYATYEYGWHPDTQSGLSISQAGNAVYPDYFIPRLNALLATVGMQAIVEISPALQKLLSHKLLQWIFPHIFTIYLIHGFIFWSIGSWAMCTLFEYGLPYWLCCLLVAIICYGSLFASLPLLTPPIEAVGKNFTANLWEHASQEPVLRKPTTFPFGPELVKGSHSLDESVVSSTSKEASL
ncbi:uncharacterized protein Z518_00323 [Rhinocladiella mackenziei CBS 650.93]|uniref:GH16 domain-containing protein n=1 Tax=Rhinocladiella mackenziei CBS 650.93 TaxID=1442369 RepID=A0A0D2IT71_9EURO|nr:uncharacterized protein Z518_00323 [Rhinocladiella mackenziei CBS 650.93]KIX09244.1 hypothetical protein Z518_00323 [Rhinocladiella mackenziei CBS 650.93]